MQILNRVVYMYSPQQQSSASCICRRCGKLYRGPSKASKTIACPHCGASSEPIWQSVNWNGVASAIAPTAIVALAIAVQLPIMSISKLNIEEVHSVIGGIITLFAKGHILLGSIIFIFSILFPVAKLLMVLTATSRLIPLRAKTRHRLHAIAVATGKYSLMDVLFVAILVPFLKLGDLVNIQPRIGLYVFLLAIVLSIAASMCVMVSDENLVSKKEHL